MFNFDFLLNKRKQIFFIFLFCLLLEMFSFVSFNFPYLNYTIFFVLTFLILASSIYKLEWGMYLILVEVFLNAMGYLFYFEHTDLKISLRIAFWLIFLAVFLAKIIFRFFKDRKIFNKIYKLIIFKNNFLYLAIFIFWGLIFGLINNNFSDVFSDFNSWLYFLLIIPFVYILKVDKNNKNKEINIWQNIIVIFTSIIIYICLKSLLFLFLFSHNITPIVSDLYSWTRRYYLGEITNMGDGLYRIFLQNQIFVLLALFFSLSAFLVDKSFKIKKYLILFSSLLLSSIIISYSRSFWLALVLSLIFMIIPLVIYKIKIRFLFYIFLSFILSFLLIFVIIKFPLMGGTNIQFGIDDLSSRANITKNESAISSRWALLDVILADAKSNFLLGRGFGTRLEYASSDPRVLETSSDGLYSTYAFEWAWLELIIKMGIFGFLAYLFLIIIFLYKNIKLFLESKNYIYFALFLAILSIAIVNFFTPYLNHPLGISYLIITFLFLDFYQRNINKIC